MKRILLTTTSLVLAAGVAQADITFSGATGIALIDDNGASSVTDAKCSNRSYQAALEAAASADAAKTTRSKRFTPQIRAADAGHAALQLSKAARRCNGQQQPLTLPLSEYAVLQSVAAVVP